MEPNLQPLFEELIQGAVSMGQAKLLVDNVTPQCKKFLDEMSVLKRRVFVRLLEQGKPTTSRELKKSCRLTINTTSATLNILRKEGLVKTDSQKKPFYYEAVDPFNMVILERPAIEVYHRVRIAGQDCNEIIIQLLRKADLIPVLKNFA